MRSESATGNPAQRYCASLGHRADDETGGLIYMRARYYEPWMGRFVSEDPSGLGRNFFAYAGNNPINHLDKSGKSYKDELDERMLLFEKLWLDRSMSLAAFLARTGELIESVLIIMDQARSEMLKHEAAADSFAASGSYEASQIERGKQLEMNTDIIIGAIYTYEMFLGAFMRIADEWGI